MVETKITDDHFYFWVEYYNKKWEVTCSTDVNEEIDVYEDHIRYENYCPWCWEDYYDFEYKLEWEKLMIKCINFDSVEFGKWYKRINHPYIKNWIYNGKEMKKYFKNQMDHEDDRYDAQWKFWYRDYIIWLPEWHERKVAKRRASTFTNKAREWVIKQIKNKNFKKD